MEENKRRSGRFYVFREMIEEYPEEVMAVMGEMVILRAEFLMARNQMEYVAVSELFEPISMAAEAPLYRISIARNDSDDSIEVSAVKVKPDWVLSYSKKYDPGDPVPLDMYWHIQELLKEQKEIEEDWNDR